MRWIVDREAQLRAGHIIRSHRKAHRCDADPCLDIQGAGIINRTTSTLGVDVNNLRTFPERSGCSRRRLTS